jgi:hypothetical protein
MSQYGVSYAKGQGQNRTGSFGKTVSIESQLGFFGAAMRIRLNRWQRVGIVLSVLVFVGIGIYTWVFEARYRDRFYSTQLSMCNGTLRTQNEALQGIGTQEDRAKREAVNQSEYEECKNEAGATLRESFNVSLERMPIFLAKVLGLIVLAWLIEWFVVEIARWINRSSHNSRRTGV